MNIHKHRGLRFPFAALSPLRYESTHIYTQHQQVERVWYMLTLYLLPTFCTAFYCALLSSHLSVLIHWTRALALLFYCIAYILHAAKHNRVINKSASLNGLCAPWLFDDGAQYQSLDIIVRPFQRVPFAL